MKCCEISNIVRKEGTLNLDNIVIPYIITYCDNCGVVRPTTSSFRDGKNNGDTKIK